MGNTCSSGDVLPIKPTVQSALENGTACSVSVSVLSARNLAKADYGGLSDPYLRISCGDHHIRSETHKDTLNPVFNERFNMIFAETPSDLYIEVWDADIGSKDDFIGSVPIMLDDRWDEKTILDTGYQWIQIFKEGKDEDDNLLQGEIQIEVVCKKNIKIEKNQLHNFLYTHLLEIEIIKAEKLIDMDVIGKNDPFVLASWGDKTFKTRTVPNAGNAATWNQIGLFWGDSSSKTHKMVFKVMDQDKKSNDSIGMAIFDPEPLYEMINEPMEFTLNIYPAKLDSDADLNNIIQMEEKDEKEREQKSCGQLIVSLTMTTKASLEKNFFKDIFYHFHHEKCPKLKYKHETLHEKEVEYTLEEWNRLQKKLADKYEEEVGEIEKYIVKKREPEPFEVDGKKKLKVEIERKEIEEEVLGLTRLEFASMLKVIGIDLEGKQLEEYWELIDKNKNGIISEEEFLNFINSVECHEKMETLFDRLFLFVKNNGSQGFESALMAGVTHPPSNPDQIQLHDYETGIVVSEHIPTYILTALKGMYTSSIGREMTEQLHGMLSKMSIAQGEKYAHKDSQFEIQPFIELHNIPLDEIEKPLEDYKSFNEFFSRKLKPGARPIDNLNDSTKAISPADSRMLVFPDIINSTVWIKGDKFSVGNLLGPVVAPLHADKFAGGSLVIARLAPQDYHRWHIPCTGVIGNTYPIDGALYTVSPIAIRQNINIYTENKRVVIELNTKEFGLVGATMVGSIVVENFKNGQKVKKGDLHGYFQFGGSTVLLLFQPNKIDFNPTLLKNSNELIETKVKAGILLGNAKGTGSVEEKEENPPDRIPPTPN